MGNNEIVLVELFSGIGGFAVGLQNAGFKILKHYFSEKDKHAIANYKYNFPNAEYIGTVQHVSGTGIRANHPTDKIIVTFGFPCQDLSIAGKRLGLKGKRSSLFYHAARTVRESQADVYIWENVAGLLSANGGDDIKAVFEEMYLSGYVFDVEELNTSWVLPQNRVRIYSVGHNIKHLQRCLIEQDGQNKNYSTSVKIIEGVLLTRYPQYLTEVQNLSEQKRNDLVLDYLKTKEQDRCRGQNLRNKFLEIIKTLQLEELRNLYQHIHSLLLKSCDANSNISQLENPDEHQQGTKYLGTKLLMAKEKQLWSIGELLSKVLDANLVQVSRYIILILENKTTIRKIFSYAEMQSNIEIFIIHLTILYPNCWNEALSNLIEKKKNINYAAKNRGSKGESTQDDDSNAIRFSFASETGNDIGGSFGAGGGQELFPITENDCGIAEGAGDTTTVRTITGGGGNSGGMHSSMTLLRVSTTEGK